MNCVLRVTLQRITVAADPDRTNGSGHYGRGRTGSMETEPTGAQYAASAVLLEEL